MPLILTDEEKMLKEAANEFLASNSSLKSFRKLRDNNYQSFDQDLWKGMIEMGWTALTIPEAYGGLDFGYTGLGQILEETGKTLAKSPLISSILFSATAIRLCDNENLKSKWLPELMKGNILMALALDEKAHFDPNNINSTAKLSGNKYVINGKKKMVLDGSNADYFIVVVNEANMTSFFLIDVKSKGIEIKSDILMDTGEYSSVVFNKVSVASENKLNIKTNGDSILQSLLNITSAGLASEMLGSMQAAFEKTMDYIKEREQFGNKIGKNQSLQHRAALLFCEIELCKSIVLKALKAIDNDETKKIEFSHLAKAKLGEVLKLTTNEAIQMHGGIGVTDDADIGFYLKRARVIQHLMGDKNYHLNCIAKIKGY
ncbi:MAG: acyl-CoA dehydrogenase [Flavobacteriaceae bacterium]|nr:acyl-CoA dehydrogenase [Flavobacteriaceae bacterium]|tara:strand:+ start:543 stop:1661 length:1119 start_codon:yes stop_codon:yes gene_type:complete